MKRLRSLTAIVLLAVAGVLSPFMHGVAAADTIVQTNYYGCDSIYGYHYRYTEFGWRTPSGHHYKTGYLDVLWKATGQMLHQNAYHSSYRWNTFIQYVWYGTGQSECMFFQCPWHSAEFTANTHWMDWSTQHDAGGRWYYGNPWSGFPDNGTTYTETSSVIGAHTGFALHQDNVRHCTYVWGL